jgi:hypothetical protein
MILFVAGSLILDRLGQSSVLWYSQYVPCGCVVLVAYRPF